MKNSESNQEVVHLLDDGWFFGNLLKTNSKIIRCNSDTSKKDDFQTSNILLKSSSLPPNFGKEEENFNEEDKEYGPTMGDLIRQAMPPSKGMPPKHTSSKVMKRNFSSPTISKSLQERRSEQTNRHLEGIRELKSRSLQRSISLNTLSLAEEGKMGKKRNFSRNNSSSFETWNVTHTHTQCSCSPPIPKWVDTKTSPQDMKEHIKLWAKSVASNVQEN